MSSFILFIGQNLNLKQTHQFLGSLVIILVAEILSRVGRERGKNRKEKKTAEFDCKIILQARQWKYGYKLINQVSFSFNYQYEAVSNIQTLDLGGPVVSVFLRQDFIIGTTLRQ